MAQQLLTLPEIRSLLARQSDVGMEDFDAAQKEAQELVSLAGGKVPHQFPLEVTPLLH